MRASATSTNALPTHTHARPRRRAAALSVNALALLFAALLLLAGCASTAAPSPLVVQPAPTPTVAVPKPVSLPADEAPHDALSEWWYYTGHLETESGRSYGFEFVFFQAVRGQNPVGYAAHFAVTDHQSGQFSYQQRSEPVLRLMGDGHYRLELHDWSMGGTGDDHQLKATGDGYAIDLNLHSTKPAALHGGKGWISFGPAGDSYYYSRTRMEIQGTVLAGGKEEKATGLAWMDHQWGDFISVNGGGWDWFSVQLNDRTEVMVTVLRSQPGNVAAVYGSYVDADGRTTELAAGDIELKSTGSWTSPHSGTTYPSGWQLRLPKQGVDLVLQPVLQDQELDTRESTGVVYWEGEVSVTGNRGGEGYVELTGYSTGR